MSVPAAYFGVILIWSTTPLAIQWSAQGASFSFAVFARMLIGLAVCMVLLRRRARPFPHPGGTAAVCGQRADAVRVDAAHLLGRAAYSFGVDFSDLRAVAAGHRGICRTVAKRAHTHTDPHCGPRAGIGRAVADLRPAVARRRPRDARHRRRGRRHGGAGAGLVWIKRLSVHISSLAITCGSLGVATPVFALAWLFADGGQPRPTCAACGGGIVYLGVLGSVLGFTLYYYVIKHLDAGRVALIMLVTPVTALAAGADA